MYSAVLPVWIAASIAWPILNFQLSNNVWRMMPVWLIFLVALVGLTKEFIDRIKMTKLEIGDEGLWYRVKTGRVLVKWVEIARYNGGKHFFTLYFKYGKRVTIPGYIKGFEELRDYSLQKLEQTGTSERMTPGVLYPVPLSTALGVWLLILTAIGVLVAFIVMLVRGTP